MKQKRAVSKYVRVSPRKARLAAGLIRGLSVDEAFRQLSASGLKSARLLRKTLQSAVVNAESQLELKRENLKISEVKIDDGATFKRSRSKNRGGRHPVLKRTSHFTVVVSSEEGAV